METQSKEEQAVLIDALKTVATPILQKAKESNDVQELCFYTVGKISGTSLKLRRLLNLGYALEKKNKSGDMSHLSSNGLFYCGLKNAPCRSLTIPQSIPLTTSHVVDAHNAFVG